MPPFLAAALAGAVPGLFKAGAGLFSQLTANAKLRALEKQRPVFEIPQEALRGLGVARELAEGGGPGARIASEAIQQSTVNAIQGAIQTGRPGESIAAIQATANQGARTLEQQRQQAVQLYLNELRNISDLRQLEFQINEFAPFADRYNQLTNKLNAGRQNFASGLDSISGVATALLGSGLVGGSAATARPTYNTSRLRDTRMVYQDGTFVEQNNITPLPLRQRYPYLDSTPLTSPGRQSTTRLPTGPGMPLVIPRRNPF